MRRSTFLLVVFSLAVTWCATSPPAGASPSRAAAVPPTTVDVNCDAGVNNAPAIEAALQHHNVVVHGWCRVDWSPLERNRSYYWKGIAVPNERIFQIAADGIVYLGPDQAVVPYDREHTPNRGSVKYADILVARDDPATNITIVGPGVLDGMADFQKDVVPGTTLPGKGYDGIQLQNVTNSRVWNLTIRNIRGVNGGGDPEGDNESFAINILNSQATAANPISIAQVTVTTSEGHRPVSATGIGTNLGANVTIEDSMVSKLNGSCFTAWRTNNVRRSDNVGNDCDSGAFRNERGSGGVDANNWYVNSGYGLAFVGESNFVATGMVITGNRTFAAVASSPNGVDPACTNIKLQGDIYPPGSMELGGGLLDPACLSDDDDQLVRH